MPSTDPNAGRNNGVLPHSEVPEFTGPMRADDIYQPPYEHLQAPDIVEGQIPYVDTVYTAFLAQYPESGGDGFFEYKPSPSDQAPNSLAVEGIPKPDTVLVNRVHGVDLVFDLLGPEADKAVAHLVADAAQSGTDLGEVKNLFWNHSLVDSVVETLWVNRAARIMRGRASSQMSSKIYQAIRRSAVKLNLPFTPTTITAYSHVFVRLMSFIDLAQFEPDEKYVKSALPWLARQEDIERAVIMKAVTPIFNEAKYKEFAATFSSELNPTTLALKLKSFFQRSVELFDEAILMVQRYKQSVSVLWKSLSYARTVPLDIRTMPELRQLGRYSNLVALSKLPFTSHVLDPFRLTEAVRATATNLMSLPGIDAISGAVYSSHFGYTPAAGKRLYKGGVAWTWLDSPLHFDLYQAQNYEGRKQVGPVSEPISYAGLRSKVFSGTILGLEGTRGVARIISDGIALQPMKLPTTPILRTVGVTEDMVEQYVMVNSDSIGVVSGSPSRQLIYSVPSSDRWLMNGVAATEKNVAFSSPNAAFLYMMGHAHALNEHVPKGIKLPAQRPLATPAGALATFEDEAKSLVPGVNEPFVFGITYDNIIGKKGTPVHLDISIPMLPSTTEINAKGRRVVKAWQSPVAYHGSPLVDARVSNLTSLAAKYLLSNQQELSRSAETWWYTLMNDVAKDSSHTSLAREAVFRAYLAVGEDGGAYTYMHMRTVTRVFIGVVIATLVRYRKARGADVMPVIATLDVLNVMPDVARDWGEAQKALSSAGSAIGISGE